MDVCVPVEPDVVDADVDVEFWEPDVAALFDEPLCVEVEPEPETVPLALVDVLDDDGIELVEVWLDVDAPWVPFELLDAVPVAPCVELVVVCVELELAAWLLDVLEDVPVEVDVVGPLEDGLVVVCVLEELDGGWLDAVEFVVVVD